LAQPELDRPKEAITTTATNVKREDLAEKMNMGVMIALNLKDFLNIWLGVPPRDIRLLGSLPQLIILFAAYSEVPMELVTNAASRLLLVSALATVVVSAGAVALPVSEAQAGKEQGTFRREVKGACHLRTCASITSQDLGRMDDGSHVDTSFDTIREDDDGSGRLWVWVYSCQLKCKGYMPDTHISKM